MAQRMEWTEPGAFQVAPGVHRIPLPLPSDGLRAVNVYAVTGEDGLVLIDGGWALEESRRRLEAALKEIGHGLADVSRFLVTHVHRDHYTQAIAVRREFGTRVSLGIGERESLDLLTGPRRREHSPQLTRLLACGARPIVERLKAAWREGGHDTSEWEMPDDWIDGRTALPVAGRELLAVPTPGHTRGHLVFADLDAGLLFAGDHVLPHITPSIGFESVPAASPLGAYLDSLRIVRELPDLRLLPAHGPVTDSVHARVDALLDHHAERLDASAAAVTAGAGTAYETARALTWTRRERSFADLDLFNQMLATTETQAHLEVLVGQGRLRSRMDGDGAVIYETVV
jgi:glyoxylase-like metal-dependent hydrolase (beta-lactamase superfamily II)